MPRRRPVRAVPGKDDAGLDDKRGGYSGAEDAATVPPPQRVPSGYLTAPQRSR